MHTDVVYLNLAKVFDTVDHTVQIEKTTLL